MGNNQTAYFVSSWLLCNDALDQGENVVVDDSDLSSLHTQLFLTILKLGRISISITEPDPGCFDFDSIYYSWDSFF